jgi:CheY-like chemotaxis protein
MASGRQAVANGTGRLVTTTENTTARVLIVEDEGVIALEIVLILRTNGYVVVGIAKSGEEALELALAERPDLVLSDGHSHPGRMGRYTDRSTIRDHPMYRLFTLRHTQIGKLWSGPRRQIRSVT